MDLEFRFQFDYKGNTKLLRALGRGDIWFSTHIQGLILDSVASRMKSSMRGVDLDMGCTCMQQGHSAEQLERASYILVLCSWAGHVLFGAESS